MTISIWRYSHLALAVSSLLFIALASVTGIILSFEAVQENSYAYDVRNLDQLSLSEVIPVLQEKYPEITELNVDDRGYVSLKGFDEEGEKVEAFINPQSGEVLGKVHQQSEFYSWVTALHRSLFLKDLGRFFIGLTAFLLSLITISGAILVIKRQHGLRRFFTRITRESFAQYYHVVLGRLMLVPIFIIAVSGTWLSLVRFGIIPEKTNQQHIIPAQEEPDLRKDVAEFGLFRNTRLSEVETIGFPFVDDDPEEFFTLKLKDRELLVNQFNGEVVSEINRPATDPFTRLSLNLHTGRSSIIWAIIIGIASVNILFFIFSGFTITIKRRRNRIRNKYKAEEARYVILTGSENGSTLFFAGAIHKQLLAQGKESFLGELNGYRLFPQAQHLIILTSTYGLGDAPGNAGHFTKLVNSIQQQHPVQVSVVGFGSKAYPDYCAFAIEVDRLLRDQNWAQPILELHTVNDRSPEEFTNWARAWSSATGITLATTAATYSQSPAGLQKMRVTGKTLVNGPEESFRISFNAPNKNFQSGDLLAIYPAGDHRVRYYSIGKVNNEAQLIVKYLPQGLGSEYLYSLQENTHIKAEITPNPHFHFPKKSTSVILIANGAGIAPFLGMLDENKRKTAVWLYAGFRKETELTKYYRQFASLQKEKGRLQEFHIALSREGNRCHVMELIKRDADFFAEQLANGAVVMICGSLAMQRDVEAVLNAIGTARNNHDINFYRQNGQILTDCY